MIEAIITAFCLAIVFYPVITKFNEWKTEMENDEQQEAKEKD